jgi:hypothetical protein
MLTFSVTSSGGVQVGNYALPFSVAGMGSTNLTFALPGNLAAGSYSVIGSLSIGGGGGQVFAGVYIVPPAPVTLACASASGATANGFTLTLQGVVGYGYLIQTSTNLVDWQPAQYIVMTNSPAYFTDYSAPSFSQRFYRAVQVSQVQTPVSPQLGAVMLVSSGGVQVTLTGGVGQAYTVQTSTNLVDWVAVTNLVLPTGAGQFTDYPVTNCPQRFYRAVVP